MKEEKDLRGKELSDLYEKRLLIARYFIKLKEADKEFSEKDMYHMWNNYFRHDFKISPKRRFKLQEGKFYSCLVLENSKNVSDEIIKSYNNKWKKIYKFLRNYVKEHSLSKCDKDIMGLRNENCRQLIKIFKPLGYFVADATEKLSDPRLAVYHLYSGKTKYNGCYSKLLEYADSIRKQNKGKEVE